MFWQHEKVIAKCMFFHFFLLFLNVCKKTFISLRYKKSISMTDIHKRYRLTSMEEPTDEMLQALMEDVGKAARESSAKAEDEKRRRLQAVAKEIKEWRSVAAV